VIEKNRHTETTEAVRDVWLGAARRYRGKPVVIEAVLWDGTRNLAGTIMNWAAQYGGAVTYLPPAHARDQPELRFRTDKGAIWAVPGDYIIWDYDKEEFYVCNSNIFAATYDQVEPAQRGSE
jgi:hypothetical protein